MNRQQRRARAKRKPDKAKPMSRAETVNLTRGGIDTVAGNFASVVDLNETLHAETGIWALEPERYRRKKVQR